MLSIAMYSPLLQLDQVLQSIYDLQLAVRPDVRLPVGTGTIARKHLVGSFCCLK